MPTFKHPCPHCGAFIHRDVKACPACGRGDPFAPARCPGCRAVIEDLGRRRGLGSASPAR